MDQAQVRSGSQDLAHQAEIAGAAFGCRFASSDDYEAALIAERRKAGAYRPRRRPTMILTLVVIAAVILLVLGLI